MLLFGKVNKSNENKIIIFTLNRLSTIDIVIEKEKKRKIQKEYYIHCDYR